MVLSRYVAVFAALFAALLIIVTATAQQTETRKLTDQVGTLTTTLDNLRQSFASTTAGDDKPAARETPRRSRSRATVNNRNRTKAAAVQRKRSR